MERSKTLSYRRADFLIRKDDLKTLEEYLSEAHRRLPTIAQRKVAGPGHPILECRKHVERKNLGILLHIAAYTPGEKASVVPQDVQGDAGDVDTADPPEKCEFMDGDIMTLVSGNHVLLCSSNLHEKKALRYMAEIIEKAGIDNDASKFGLSRAADINKIKLIQTQGVRSVNIDASLFDASLEYMERKTVTQRLSGRLMDEVKALFAEDENLEDLKEAENLSAHIVLKFDGRRKDKVLGRERVETVAKRLLDDEDDGFSIETMKGETIKGKDITLRKSVVLPKHGKSVFCADAWKALEEYYYELRDNGLLEQ